MERDKGHSAREGIIYSTHLVLTRQEFLVLFFVKESLSQMFHVEHPLDSSLIRDYENQGV